MADFAHQNGAIFENDTGPTDDGANDGMANGHDSAINSNNVNGINLLSERVTRKAKRPSKSLSFDFNRTKSESSIVAPLRALKNSRKSRNRYGRGLPKKGGAGGKGTWGALGSEIVDEEEEGAIDDKDPNFDDEKLDSKVVKMNVINVEKTVEEIEKKSSTVILEYFDHGDTEEVLMSLEELKMTSRAHVVISTAIEIAMDHKPSHREMTSVLLADLYGTLFYEDDYAIAFDHLLTNLNDLILDTPEATTILGNFIARSIADDCVAPKFLQSHKGKITCELAIKALVRAEGLLSMRHGLVRLDNVWGVGGGTRPVKHLVNKMVLLLKEYVSSSDVKEATRCLQELEVPHFHHELVYEAINMVLEEMNDRTTKLICGLLKSLCNSLVVTPSQMREGFIRIYEDMPQISLDVPPAYIILEKFVKVCHDSKIIDNETAKKIPIRGRKRFVSEGDGGRVKDNSYF